MTKNVRHAWKAFRQVDIFLDKHAAELLAVLVAVTLFLPNFFEPFWRWDSTEAYHAPASPLSRLGVPSITNYKTFGTFIIKYISDKNYRTKFSELISDNTAAAKILRTSTEPTFFLWGNNSILYDFARKQPAFKSTLSDQEMISSLQQSSPTYIVVMNDAPDLPGLREYLNHSYMPNYHFHHFVLWRKW